MPLVEIDGSEFDFNKYRDLPVRELINKKILPNIKGAYKNSGTLLDGVLISHPHMDHYGFASYLHPEIHYYIGEAAFRIISVSNLFIGKDPMFINHTFYQKEQTFQLGNISVTPYWMDHSAFDSYAFLIEAEGKRLFYSGDFRGHGRKSRAFQRFFRIAPKDIDYLLLEGTMVGRGGSGKEKTEVTIKHELTKVFKENKISLVYTSGQNIDRLVSIYKACNASGKILVIDPYIASILKVSAKFAKLHHPSESFKNIKVLFPYFLTGRMLKSPNKNLIYQFTPYKITKDRIDKDPGKYVLCVRPSMRVDLAKMSSINGGNLVYSLWEGYLSKQPTKGFIDYLSNQQFTLHKVHTSGHADIATLQSLVNAINPMHIIPIHTFAATEYHKVFSQPIKQLSDSQTLTI
jgi:ribonuclease J